MPSSLSQKRKCQTRQTHHANGSRIRRRNCRFVSRTATPLRQTRRISAIVARPSAVATTIACVRAGRDRHAPRALTDSTDPELPIDRIEPTEPIERIDPAEPMLAIEPALPMDAIEPAEPIEAIEPAEPIDAIDPKEPMDAIEVVDDFTPLAVRSIPQA